MTRTEIRAAIAALESEAAARGLDLTDLIEEAQEDRCQPCATPAQLDLFSQITGLVNRLTTAGEHLDADQLALIRKSRTLFRNPDQLISFAEANRTADDLRDLRDTLAERLAMTE